MRFLRGIGYVFFIKDNEMTLKEYEYILQCVKRLHNINFNELIKHKNFNDNFSYRTVYDENENCFKSDYEVIGYCDKCASFNAAEKDENEYRLCNISHGSHTFDFLEAFGIEDVKAELIHNYWNTQPVLFLMETPSVDYNIYNYLKSDIDHKGKRPAYNWYWIHEDWTNRFNKNEFNGAKHFGVKSYGKMVASLIYQYKLANAYLTNFVKCGMNYIKYENSERIQQLFLNITNYNKDCIDTCFGNVLNKEIDALRGNNQLIIFTFGNSTYDFAKKYLNDKEKYYIRKLPHPANYHISNDYRKYILKGIVEETLQKYK